MIKNSFCRCITVAKLTTACPWFTGRGSLVQNAKPISDVATCRLSQETDRFNYPLSCRKHSGPSYMLGCAVVPMSRTYSTCLRQLRSVTDKTAMNNGSITVQAMHVNVDKKLTYEADWSKHELSMVTCAEMWDEWPSGAQVVVSYIDTAARVSDEWQRAQKPTALMLPSCLTDYVELKPTMQALVDLGFRLIIPDVIGYGTTRGLTKTDEECFSNLVGERSAFVLDFVSALGLSRFDIAIGHGFGCDPITVLAANFDVFNNIVLVSPVPAIRSLSLMEPVWLTRRMLYWSFNWLRAPLARLWFMFIFHRRLLKSSSIDKFSFHRMRTILSFLHGRNFDSMASMATLVDARQIPVLYIYSDIDPMINCASHEEYAELFGVTSENIHSCSEVGQLHSGGGNADVRYARGIKLPCSTGQPFESEINQAVVTQIRALVESRSSSHLNSTLLS